SYERGSRLLLLAACAALGAALLSSEASYPLAALGPVLVWLIRRRGKDLLTWVWTWAGTVAVLGARVLLFLRRRGTDSYQANQFKALEESGAVIRHAHLHLDAFFTYFHHLSAAREYWLPALIALLLVGMAAWVMLWKRPRGATLGACLLGILLSALAVVCGVAPFFHLATRFRTQFFAAPGEAALLACALGGLTALLPARLGRTLCIAAAAVLVAGVTAAMHRSQDAVRPCVSFEKTVHVFAQLRAAGVPRGEDTLVILVREGEGESPLGPNYALSE